MGVSSILNMHSILLPLMQSFLSGTSQDYIIYFILSIIWSIAVMTTLRNDCMMGSKIECRFKMLLTPIKQGL